MMQSKKQKLASRKTIKAKKSTKKGSTFFDNYYYHHILKASEDPKLFCKWVAMFEEHVMVKSAKEDR